MRTLNAVATAILLTLSLVAAGCNSDPTTEKEDTAMLREAICSGGGGGGDACTTTGYCPAECSQCFSSVSERVKLQNLWACDPLSGGGGGGGGGGGSHGCSQTQINSLVTACHHFCDGPSACSQSGVVQYCTTTGIQFCRINSDGSLEAPCAETWEACP